MPIYSYHCKKCGNNFEEIAKYEEAVICGKCAYITHKVPSKSNFILVGEGWANDGYSKKTDRKNK